MSVAGCLFTKQTNINWQYARLFLKTQDLWLKSLCCAFFFFFFSALDATVCPRILVSNCARYSHRIFPGYSVFNLLQDFYSRWILHRAYSLWFLWTQTFHHLSLKKIQTCTRLFIEASTLRRLLTNSNFPNSSLTSSPGTDLLLK